MGRAFGEGDPGTAGPAEFDNAAKIIAGRRGDRFGIEQRQ